MPVECEEFLSFRFVDDGFRAGELGSDSDGSKRGLQTLVEAPNACSNKEEMGDV